MKKIKIRNKTYRIKYSIRALFIFESITGKPFKIDTLLDNYIFFYAVLLASNMDKDNIITWDDFLDELDVHPDLFNKIATALEDDRKQDKIFGDDADDADTSKKK